MARRQGLARRGLAEIRQRVGHELVLSETRRLLDHIAWLEERQGSVVTSIAIHVNTAKDALDKVMAEALRVDPRAVVE